MTDLPSLKLMGHRRLNARINVGQGPPGAKTCLRGANAITLANSLRFFEGMLSPCGQATFDQRQCRPDLNDLRSGKTSEGGKNETVTSSAVLVRTHFYPVRMAGLVLRASDGNGKASAGKY